MKKVRKYAAIIVCGVFALMASGCAAEVGSDQWCAEMKQKAKADWTSNEAIDYAKHCLLK